MTNTEGVIYAFLPARERCQAIFFLDRVDLVTPTGEHLVYICLMAGVPQDDVMRRAKHPMQCNAQLDGTQVGAEVSTVSGDGFNQPFTNFDA